MAGGAQLGAVIVGPAGVGKTVALRSVVEQYVSENAGTTTHWAAGTASAKNIPLGAFSHLIESSASGESVTLLKAARHALFADTGDGLLLAVDDAHQLDSLSATLIHQLALAGSARILLTVRSQSPVPDAVTALWKDRVLARVDLEPLTRDETDALLCAVLDGLIETASAERLYTLSGGNPLYLRHLVEGGLASGALRPVEGVWQMRGTAPLTPQLSTLIDSHLDALPAPVRAVLEYLAVEEPLRLSDLSELCGIDAVEHAEAAHAITAQDHHGEILIFPAHPLYAESVRASTPRLAARRRRTELVQQLASAPARNVVDRLRLAALALDTDSAPAPSELVSSAWEAMQLGDLVLGEQFARAALDKTGDIAARLPLAHSLSWQGRGQDAEDVLDPVHPESLSEWELMAWALPKAANQFWMLRDSQNAIDFLENVRNRLQLPAALHTIDALRATFAMSSGQPRRAADLATDVLAAPDADDLAVAWASATATLSSARLGRFAEVATLAERGLAASHPGLLRFTIGLGQTTAMIMDGELAAAEDIARHYLGFASFAQPGRAIGEVLLAHTLLARGDLPQAVSLLQQAAAALTTTGYSWGPLALVNVTTALGQLGRAAEAAAHLERAQANLGMRARLYAPELALAKAWARAAARDMPGAISAARDAAAAATGTEQKAIALRALQDGLRLGDGRTARRVLDADGPPSCRFETILRAHAHALSRHDGDRLQAVSQELADIGMVAAAADVAAQAAAAFETAGQRSAAADAKSVAVQRAQRCGRPSTPALERLLQPLPLTGREREVAVMVSHGLSNKDIADRLCVSVRTVEGHVYRACSKLEVADRGQLAAAVTAGHLQDVPNGPTRKAR